ncbi:cell division control protein Cdc25 [Aspergillus bombycis]|uniref:Class E vacuolar protein-sorting machinery protein HSE1 n=1 Tax=Aspergillus bombycis TaxID=109264 RepID=A0A1F8A2F9_9EURO|nr:cell division control protein Cdc25 [Aspergillus bombycis]OGM45902.1 cell division control protein Cdc25 [Aspergillus bombycis]
MHDTRLTEPLVIDTKSALATKAGTTITTTFAFTEEQASTPTTAPGSRSRGSSLSFHYRDNSVNQSPQGNQSPAKMAATGRFTPSPEPAPALFVRAMYDYDADDHTSLSFRRGDIIQVLNQLETGWWDGVINNSVRGWFPSNYCTIITDLSELEEHVSNGHEDGDISAESGLGEEYEEDREEDEVDSAGNPRDSQPILPIEGTGPPNEQEEAAFWIPQATPDGRLFYFNTLTGYSTMELPFENPSTNETGPYDRNTFCVPNQTRPPPELMARGFERDEDEYDGSASEAEGESLMLASHDSMSRRRQSYIDGVSPATSMDSLHPPSATKSINEGKSSFRSLSKAYSFGTATSSTTSLSDNFHRPSISSEAPSHFVDDGASAPLTWPLLVDNMRTAVEAYRQTLLNGDRSEYVRKAEDISDHLRMLLAAGSDTTDNHSGNPSIISTNKALYPHFRDMMSKFSKLVLSSHIAAADWPSPDSVNKCLQEADGVMQGVYGYVDIARQQRGDFIRRIVPGFVVGSCSGGGWQNNGVTLNDSGPTSFLDQDGGDTRAEPAVPLDAALLDHIDILRRSFVGSIRRLEERLSLNQKKIVTIAEHHEIGDSVSAAAIKVIEQFRPWVSSVESINLAPLGTSFQNPQLVDFSLQKQRVYDAIADFVLGCQAVTSPLGDEWAELRGDSLEDRLNAVRGVARQLENYVSQIGFSLSLLLEQIPESATAFRSESRLSQDNDGLKALHSRAESQAKIADESIGIPSSYSVNPPHDKVRRNMDKAQRFFGQAPPTAIPREPIREPVREPEETPWFLKMDHEGEVFYDTKNDVPTLKCGTLAGLVEHLTRHDKLDASFNNTFLLTYRSFTTAAELFELLTQRFNIQPPFGLNQEEMQMWIDRKQKPIRFRIVNILKSWFENFWMEPNDEAHMKLLERVHAFTKDSIATTKTPGSPPLLTVIEQRLRGQDTTVKRLVPTQAVPAPSPIIPKNMKKLKFLDIDPTEFARQLTIIESRLYSKIRPIECLNKTWQKKVGPDEPEPATNVKALILHSNQLTNWVAEMILSQSDVKKRVVVIKHFVNVADKCRALNNYSTLTSIISALGTAPIHRLGRTWGQVSGRTSTILEQMRKLMASTKNFGEYRETLHLANPPCIPFFGVYLTDLTFIEDGIPSLTPSELINFNKRAKTAEVIRDIQQYQNVPYLLQPVPELQDYILSNLQAAGDVHDMYDRSLEVEPREREDEKIARYATTADCCLNRASCKSANSVSPSGHRLRYVETPVAASTTHVPSCSTGNPTKFIRSDHPRQWLLCEVIGGDKIPGVYNDSLERRRLPSMRPCERRISRHGLIKLHDAAYWNLGSTFKAYLRCSKVPVHPCSNRSPGFLDISFKLL